MPLWTSAIEPVLAPFQIVVGASNYQAAAKSTACWIFAGVLAGFLVAYRRRSKSLWAVQIGNSVLFASGYTLLFVLYMLAAVLIPLPSWSLVMKDPANAIVADLHSHTIVSQDGIVSKEQNPAVHQSRGYDVVALTEHHPVERWIRVSANSIRLRLLQGSSSAHGSTAANTISFCWAFPRMRPSMIGSGLRKAPRPMAKPRCAT